MPLGKSHWPPFDPNIKQVETSPVVEKKVSRLGNESAQVMGSMEKEMRSMKELPEKENRPRGPEPLSEKAATSLGSLPDRELKVICPLPLN